MVAVLALIRSGDHFRESAEKELYVLWEDAKRQADKSQFPSVLHHFLRL